MKNFSNVHYVQLLQLLYFGIDDDIRIEESLLHIKSKYELIYDEILVDYWRDNNEN